MNGATLLAYTEQVLAPELRLGDVVVMDNLPAHKISSAREAIKKVGARLLFLPPYTPDFSPIGWSYRSSRPCTERQPPEPLRISGPLSPLASPPSPPTSAGTTSTRRDMTRVEANLL